MKLDLALEIDKILFRTTPSFCPFRPFNADPVASGMLHARK